MATQNPIEQEGTYPLPEAQVDRFMLKVLISYPKKEEEAQIIRQQIRPESQQIRPVVSIADILELRRLAAEVISMRRSSAISWISSSLRVSLLTMGWRTSSRSSPSALHPVLRSIWHWQPAPMPHEGRGYVIPRGCTCGML